MISVQELRVGNLINSVHVGMQNVCTIGANRVNGNLLKYFEPIPLTPDILIACGFTKFRYPPEMIEMRDRYFYFKTVGYIQITFTMGETVLVGKNESDIQSQVILSKSIRQLNQLQNLYFALTQTELNYTPIIK